MKKAEIAMLERIFSSEIDAALSKNPIRGIFQTRADKTIKSLKDQGMVVEIELTLPGRLPVTVRGWALTPLGHITYCFSCD